MPLPNWRRGDLADRLGNHMAAEAIYERDLGDVLQVLERVVVREMVTQDARPFYRLVEVRDGRPRIVLGARDTLREARAAANVRAKCMTTAGKRARKL